MSTTPTDAANEQAEQRHYRLLPHPDYRPAQFALARRYRVFENAVADMGEGIVVDDNGDLAAFHERHLPLIERRAASAGASHGSGNSR